MPTLTWTTKDGLTVTLNSSDRRVVDVYSDRMVFCRTARAADELAGELRAWGIKVQQDDEQLTFAEPADIDCEAA